MLLGIVGGSSFLKSEFFASMEIVTVDTAFGGVALRRTHNLVFCQRHQSDPVKEYRPPHAINFRAIVAAMKKLGVTNVVSFCSVGSLQSEFPIGSVAVMDDYFYLFTPTTLHDDSKRGHIVPGFDERLRDTVLDVLRGAEPAFPLLQDKGTYVQTQGPRFETKAEVRVLRSYGDVVGMTGATEANLFQEIGIPHALICCIDNMAHGVVPSDQLTYDAFHKGVADNLAQMERVVQLILAHFCGVSSKDGNVSTHPSREVADLVVCGRWVVPVDTDEVLEHHAIVVKDGKIMDICPSDTVMQKYAAKEVVHKSAHALMPSLINCHTHMGMTLLRGFADDLHLSDWLQHHIWPAEAKMMSPEFVRAGVELACAELIRAGCGMVNDMYFFPEVTADVVDGAGMRGLIGAPVFDFPTGYGSGADDYLAKAEVLIKKYQDNDRVKACVAPHAPYTVSDANLTKIKQLSDKYDVPVHVHMHETKAEVVESVAGNRESDSCHNSDEKCAPLKNFDRLGLVNEKLLAVHLVHIDQDDIDLLAKRGAHAVHCPVSNMKLASGFCPVAKLLKAGVNTAVGTDSVASNNSLDMMSELRMASLLAKGVSSDPTAAVALESLRMATLYGARALKREQEVGSLTIGKQADFISVYLSDVELVPMFDVASHLVYSACRENVFDMWVGGKALMRDRKLQTLSKKHIVAESQRWGKLVKESSDKKQ